MPSYVGIHEQGEMLAQSMLEGKKIHVSKHLRSMVQLFGHNAQPYLGDDKLVMC
jgi:hypothetical protein